MSPPRARGRFQGAGSQRGRLHLLTIKTQGRRFSSESEAATGEWQFLRRQLERAMPKRRLDEAHVLAAVAADDLRGNATLLAATSRPRC